MKASWVALLLAGVALAGCNDANPSLAAPKLVLAPREDGKVEVFIHAAFGERLYERLRFRVDNMTVADEIGVFSVERTLDNTSFYFEAIAETARETYQLRGRASLQPEDDQFRIAFHAQDDGWTDPQDFGTPFERVMSLRETP